MRNIDSICASNLSYEEKIQELEYEKELASSMIEEAQNQITSADEAVSKLNDGKYLPLMIEARKYFVDRLKWEIPSSVVSSEAFVEALRKEMEVAIAVGVPQIVINSGAKSEQFLRARFPDLQPQGFIHYGNFIGATLSLAAELGIHRVTMGIMLGKAVKLAEGNLDTHSKNVVMNRGFLKKVAEEAGCSPAAAAEIERLTLARELWDALQQDDLQRFLNAILARCRAACETVYPVSAGKLDILLLDEEGNVFESIA